MYVQYGASAPVCAQVNTYTAQDYCHANPFTAYIQGHATAGAQPLVIYFSTAGNTNDQPFKVLNPTGADDGRLGQSQSVFVVTMKFNSFLFSHR